MGGTTKPLGGVGPCAASGSGSARLGSAKKIERRLSLRLSRGRYHGPTSDQDVAGAGTPAPGRVVTRSSRISSVSPAARNPMRPAETKATL